jgi:hypothetical protein
MSQSFARTNNFLRDDGAIDSTASQRFTGTNSPVILGAAGDSQVDFEEQTDGFAIRIGNNANAFTDRILLESSNATNAHDIVFYDGDGTTPRLTWDESANQWVFGSNVSAGANTITTAILSATNEIYVPAGSVTDAVLCQSTDQDTGIYFPADDQIAIAAGGVQMMNFIEGTNDYVHLPVPMTDDPTWTTNNQILPGTLTTITNATLFTTGTQPVIGTGGDPHQEYKWMRVGNMVYCWFFWKWGTTGDSDGTGTFYLDPEADGLPAVSTAWGTIGPEDRNTVGTFTSWGSASSNSWHFGFVVYEGDNDRFILRRNNNTNLGAGTPFGWDSDDVIRAQFIYPTI